MGIMLNASKLEGMYNRHIITSAIEGPQILIPALVPK